MNPKSKKFELNSLIIIPILIFIFAIFNLSQGYSLVGKTFSGFNIEYSLRFSSSTQKDWTGYSANFKNYDRIVYVNGKSVKNVKEFDHIIQQTQPGTPVNYTYLRGNKLLHTTIDTMEFTLDDFITTFSVTFLISLVYLLLSIFIILKSNNNESVKALLLFTLLITISFSCYYDTELTHNFPQLVYFIQIFTMASLIQLGIIINKNNIKDKNYNFLLNLNLLCSSLFTYSFVISCSIIINDLHNNPLIFNINNKLFTFAIYYVAISFLIFCFLIFYNYSKSSVYSLQKMQSRIILTGSLLSFMPVIVFWVVPSMFGYKTSSEYPKMTFAIFPFFVTYAIIRYKAFDIEVFIRKGLVYSTLSGILIVSYFSLSTLIVVFWQKTFNVNEQTPIALSAIIATIITSKISKKVQTLIDKAFYRQKFDFAIMLEKFYNDIPKIFEKNELINICFSYLENTINPISIAFYLFERQDQKFKLLEAKNGTFPEKMDIESLSSIKDTSVLDKYDLSDSMSLTLQKDQEIIGKLILGKKKSDIEYLFDEKNFLKKFAVGTSMALDNIILKEDSIALSVKNIKLENTADFLNNVTANLSHDLQSPLSSSRQTLKKITHLIKKKASISTNLIQPDIEKLSKSYEKIYEYIDISLDRELISLGKLVLKMKPVNIKQVCEDAVFLHSDSLENKKVTVKFKFPEEELFISGDRVRFEHVISNLISNACKYGGQMMIIQIEKNNSDLLLTVEDNGAGIKESIKDKIFERYVQSGILSNSGSDRSTGLGLFICKTYIEMMNGSIWFKSSGNGTKFFIKMPLLEDTNLFIPDEEPAMGVAVNI